MSSAASRILYCVEGWLGIDPRAGETFALARPHPQNATPLPQLDKPHPQRLDLRISQLHSSTDG
jgi:hypothetical protein